MRGRKRCRFDGLDYRQRREGVMLSVRLSTYAQSEYMRWSPDRSGVRVAVVRRALLSLYAWGGRGGMRISSSPYSSKVISSGAAAEPAAGVVAGFATAAGAEAV
jgi:hypothetical protein